jgi:AraC-like DNA-binding protein
VPMLTSRAHLAAGSALVELHPAKRWRALIELALGCAHDLPTVAAWAREAGMCETQLRLRCRLAGITAKVSLDFVRVLRAALLRERRGGRLHDYLDVGDARTLRQLCARAGLGRPGDPPVWNTLPRSA